MKMIDISREERKEIVYRSTHFNLHFNRSKKYNDVYFRIADVVGSGYVKELWCFLTNTARAIKAHATYMKIPKDKNIYSMESNTQKISYRKMCRMLDTLVEDGWLYYYQGGFDPCAPDNPIPSFYKIMPKLYELYSGIDIDEDVCYSGELAEVKNRETREYILRQFKGIGLVRNVMREYNDLLSCTDFTLFGELLPIQQYKRVFSGDMASGGRVYNVVGGVQIMSPYMRSHLKMNGEDVVELDFKSLHPAILYELEYNKDHDFVEAWVMSQMGEFDPYTDRDIEQFLEVDWEAIKSHKEKHNLPDYNPVRNMIKFATLVSLNAKEGKRHKMGVAAQALLHEYNKDDGRAEANKKYVGIGKTLMNGSNGYKQFPAILMCQHVHDKNLPIQDYFFNDIGVQLQYIDSCIVVEVIEEMTNCGIVVLSEHDSIICTEDHADEVEKLMRKAYKKHTGGDKFCQIERK